MAKIKGTKGKLKSNVLKSGDTVIKPFNVEYADKNPAKASPFGLPRKRSGAKKK